MIRKIVVLRHTVEIQTIRILKQKKKKSNRKTSVIDRNAETENNTQVAEEWSSFEIAHLKFPTWETFREN